MTHREHVITAIAYGAYRVVGTIIRAAETWSRIMRRCVTALQYRRDTARLLELRARQTSDSATHDAYFAVANPYQARWGHLAMLPFEDLRRKRWSI